MLTIFPNLLSYKSLSGNKIDEILSWRFILTLMVFLNYLKLIMINNHKNQKRNCHIFLFFVCLWRKRPWHNVCYDPFYHIFQYYGIHLKQIERTVAFIIFRKFFAIIFSFFVFKSNCTRFHGWLQMEQSKSWILPILYYVLRIHG